MTNTFYGVVQDKETGKWKYRYKKDGNKYPSYHKKKYVTEILAAFARDKEIQLRVMREKDDKANQRNFTDSELAKLQKIKSKNRQGKAIPVEKLFTFENKEVAKIIERSALVKVKKLEPTEEDIKLAEKAFVDIKSIYIKHHQEAYLAVANYIAETFFDNDPDLIKTGKPAAGKNMSFRQLGIKLRGEDSGGPSESWMYNALWLLRDNFLIKQEGKELFHTYGNLPVSHMVRLTTVKDMSKKKKLIKGTEKKIPPVREFQKRINTALGKSEPQKTYRKELQGIKNDLKKRLQTVKELPKSEKKKIDVYTQVEEFLTESIERVKQFLELDMFD